MAGRQDSKKVGDGDRDCKTCSADCIHRHSSFKPTELWAPCFFWESMGVVLIEDEEANDKRGAVQATPSDGR